MLRLYAPNSYREANCEERKKICNGCGASGGIKVPDFMWGLNIADACNIHDWMFSIGKTLGDFEFANSMFEYNLRQIIKDKSNFFMRPLRLARSDKYVFAVEKFGEDAFWANKDDKNVLENITYKGGFK